jgi:predicted Zn-dependent peptidase
MHKDLPQSYVYDLLDELLWPKQALGASIIGTVESVSSMGREDIDSFRKRYYACANIIVSAAGFLDHEKFAKSVQRIFSSSKPGAPNLFLPAQEKQNKPQLKICYKDTEQTHMALGFHSLRRDHPLKHALGILHVILGANMSSRLFNEVREKRGLAYEIGTAVKRFDDTGSFAVHAGIDNHKVSQATKLILQELRKCKDKPVTIGEFKRAKEFYLGQLMLALEDTLDHMLWIGETTAVLDKTYSLEEIVSEVKKVKREDLRLVAKEVFQEKKLNLALIGPLKDKEQDIHRQLKI